MSERTRYPLSWPEGWPRTRTYERRRWPQSGHSMSDSCDYLSNQLRLLGASNEILSTNLKLKLDGAPYANLPQPNDTGAAVYFEFKKKAVSLACDKWYRVEDNVWAIAKHIEALRGQQRWGVGSLEQAFRGYMALPGIGQSSGISWWTVLGVPVNASFEQVREAYKLLVRKHHPDAGGDSELFRRVQEAWELFERQTKKPQA